MQMSVGLELPETELPELEIPGPEISELLGGEVASVLVLMVAGRGGRGGGGGGGEQRPATAAAKRHVLKIGAIMFACILNYIKLIKGMIIVKELQCMQVGQQLALFSKECEIA